VNPYALAAPIAPHLAAADEGVMLSLDRMVQGYRVLASRAERVVVEGAGGWSVPLDAERTLADLAVALELPVVLVVGLRLGCLNHALLTQAAIVASGLRFAAWVANTIDADMRERERNVDALQARLRAPCIGRIPDLRADGERGAPALDLDALAI
jgi:dethiobiotin synthetase